MCDDLSIHVIIPGTSVPPHSSHKLTFQNLILYVFVQIIEMMAMSRSKIYCLCLIFVLFVILLTRALKVELIYGPDIDEWSHQIIECATFGKSQWIWRKFLYKHKHDLGVQYKVQQIWQEFQTVRELTQQQLEKHGCTLYCGCRCNGANTPGHQYSRCWLLLIYSM